jgi:adenylate kinase family enzyme
LRRVLVIGPGGSGKSTFARELARRTGLPLVHLDTLFWSPGWVATPDVDWDRTIAELIAREEWIMDGNYGRTLATRLAACDTVIFLDVPPLVCLWRVWRRSRAYRGRSRPDLAEGCPERLTWEFVWWILTYRRRRRPGILGRLASLRPEQRAIILRRTRDARRYLDALQPHEGATGEEA